MGSTGKYVFVRPHGDQLAELVRLHDQGKLRIPVFEAFPLERAVEAHRLLEEGGVRGKIILTV